MCTVRQNFFDARRGEFSFSGPWAILNWGPFWKGCDDWCHTNQHYRCSLHSLNKLFQFITILIYSVIPSISGTKTVITKLTKKPAVKLSDNTPITYLLSSLCNCTICRSHELALNKAPVLVTTSNSLLLYIVRDRRDFCLQNRWKLCHSKACSAYRIPRLCIIPPSERNLLRILY